MQEHRFSPSRMREQGHTARGCTQQPSEPRHARGHADDTLDHQPPSRPAAQKPTTSALTAAMLVYALGAGITAAAGTRLALQSLLITVFG